MDKFALYYQVPYVKEFEAEVTSCVSSGRKKENTLLSCQSMDFTLKEADSLLTMERLAMQWFSM